MPALLHGALTASVIAAFREVYDHLSCGYLESLCSAALELELRLRGHAVEREVLVQVHYKGARIGTQRFDMVVDGRLVVEVKVAADIHASVIRQVRSYLRATDLELGLIVNFGPRPDFRRVIFTNDFKPELASRRAAEVPGA